MLQRRNGGPFKHSQSGKDLACLSIQPPYKLAVSLELIHFCPKSRAKKSSSDTTIKQLSLTSYINWQYQWFFVCWQNLWEIFQWAMIHIIVLCAIHIIGKRNVLADKLFRGRSVIRLTELLSESVYCKTHIQTFDPPNIDLFVTWENRKLQVCYSLFPM